jgi:cobyrinic acid a,c-diamide synthase
VDRLLVSATRKSSGKTMLALGLCAAWQARGVEIQPFKKGPDYIDPMWLGAAARRPCINLDFHTQTEEEILASFGRYTSGADLAVVEGNKGLFDGMDLHGSDSNAALAALLHAPVLLVVDVEGMTRGVAPLINGYRTFGPDIDFAGVVLNNYAGTRHLGKLRAVIETYTDMTVLGAVPRSAELKIAERHLGLTTLGETGGASGRLESIGGVVADSVDLDALRRIAGRAPPLDRPGDIRGNADTRRGPRIGIPRDEAFCFYYPDDLDRFRQLGAELVFFDTLRDQSLPPVDALFIGGGFPETQAARLENNAAMRHGINRFLAGGGPVYAECGGLMYLAKGITWRDRRYEMVGAIDAEIRMEKKPVGRGYVELEAGASHPWSSPRLVRAHEFHYSRLLDPPSGARYGFRVRRGQGIDGNRDGLVQGNLFAAYAHQRDTRENPWVSEFLTYVARLLSERDSSAHETTARS